MSTYYGTVAVVAGTRAKAEVGTGGLSGVLLGNESGLTIKVTLDGTGSSKSLYPGYVDWFPIPSHGFNGNIVFDPVANLSNISSWPSSYVQIDMFGPMEAPTGTYPVALPRLNNVGNTVSTNMGSSTSVQNDNNAANTQFIEATVSGSPSSNVSIDNSGNSFIAQTVGGVVTKLFQTVANAATCVLLGAASKLVEVLGNLKVDGTLESVGAATMDSTLSVTGTSALSGAVTASAAGTGLAVTNNATVGGTLGVTGASTLTGAVGCGSDITLNNNTYYKVKDSLGTARGLLTATGVDDTAVRIAGSGSKFLVLNQAGTSILNCDASAFSITAKKINDISGNNLADWTAGGVYIKGNPSSNGPVHYQADGTNTDWSLGAISTFTGTGSGTYNHGVKEAGTSVAPDHVIPIVTAASSSATQGYASVTSTQVTVTLGASLAFKATAIKYS